MKTIYVGNLPRTVSEEQVSELFQTYGDVYAIRLVTDRDTGQPRGFGFIDMDGVAAKEAIDSLNGAKLGERNLRVNPALSRKGHPARRAHAR